LIDSLGERDNNSYIVSIDQYCHMAVWGHLGILFMNMIVTFL